MKKFLLLMLYSFSVITGFSQLSDSLHIDTTAKKGEPVLFKGDTLFRVFTAPAKITVQERVGLIESRLNKIAVEPSFDEKALTVTADSGNVYNIRYKELPIIYLMPEDAAANNTSSKELAQKYQGIIKDKLLAYYAFSSPKSIAISTAEAIAIVLVLCFIIIRVNKLYKLVVTRYINSRSFNALNLKKYQLVSSTQFSNVVTRLLNFARWVTIILIVYLSLPLIFSLFPWTKNFADKLIGFIVSPFLSIIHSFTAYFPNLITIIVIYFITKYIVRLIKYFATEIAKGNLSLPGFYADWAMSTFNIVKALLYIFMFIVIFPYLPGSDSKIFQGVSVFLGVLFSIGSSSAIANVVAGVVITYMRPFKIGDRVKIGDVVGDVLEKNLLVTRIKTIKNEEITIPNATILSGGTTNYSSLAKDKGLILHTTVTIGYDVPWKQVHELLISAAKASEYILQEPAPFVLQTSLDDSYVSYQINAYTNEAQRMMQIYSSLHQNIQDKFNEAGVEIMSPAYHALRDGNTVTIPPDSRPADYKPDSFKVSGQ
ncbi:mechanosensitive ion channel family protein [Chitinophagaceae bacterium LWZ2-11]